MKRLLANLAVSLIVAYAWITVTDKIHYELLKREGRVMEALLFHPWLSFKETLHNN